MSPHLKTRILVVAACVLTGTLTEAVSQWNKKPYAKWTAYDAEKVLNDSPWGKTDVLTTLGAMFRQVPTKGAGGATTQSENIHVNFRLRFLSARPIRLAVARLLEINHKGSRTPEFEQMLRTMTTGEFVEYIVVTLSVDAPEPGMSLQQALAVLHRQSTTAIRQTTYLEALDGAKAFLLEYQPPREDGLGGRFLFPRVVEGKPFLTPESREVRIVSEFFPNHRIDKRFKLKDMVYEGKLEF